MGIKMKSSKKVFKIIIYLVVTFSIAKIIVVNLVATNGIEINQIEKQTNSIEQENKMLNGEIARLSSLRRIADEAIKLGFSNTGTVASLSQPAPLALR